MAHPANRAGRGFLFVWRDLLKGFLFMALLG